jgi:hypothetical protein
LFEWDWRGFTPLQYLLKENNKSASYRTTRNEHKKRERKRYRGELRDEKKTRKSSTRTAAS